MDPVPIRRVQLNVAVVVNRCLINSGIGVTVGDCSTFIVTSSLEGAQVPFEIVQAKRVNANPKI